MGHCISYNSFPIKTDVKKIQNELNKKAIRESDTHSELNSPIRFIDIICKNEKEAKEYINSHDGGWYDNLAVKYYHTAPNKNKKCHMLGIKLHKLIQEYSDLEQERLEINKPFHTCRICKSKFNTKYFIGKNCPVCHNDIRLKSLLNKINKLQKKINETDQKISMLNKELFWLVKIEYHV